MVFVLFFVFFLFVGGGFIGGEFVSQGDCGEFVIFFELLQEVMIQQMNQVVQKVEDYFFKNLEVVNVFISVGIGFGGMGFILQVNYKVQLMVKFILKEKCLKFVFIISQLMKQDLEKILLDIKVNLVFVGIMGSVDDVLVQVIVLGNLVDFNMVVVNKMMDVLNFIKGMVEVKLLVEIGNFEVIIFIDCDWMVEFGLLMDVVGFFL